MQISSGPPGTLNDRVALFWQRATRLAARLAIAFGLSVVAAVLLGAAVTDNWFVQLLVTMLAALGLWIPFAVLVTKVDQLFGRRSRSKHSEVAAGPGNSSHVHDGWRRLSTVAPRHSARIEVLRRSLERSRTSLGGAELDPQAHDLCVLIDRRLPDLIHRELDTLPPDDRGRAQHVDGLVDLIEQFARHCSRARDGQAENASFEAAVLRRRFEERLSEDRLIGPGNSPGL